MTRLAGQRRKASRVWGLGFSRRLGAQTRLHGLFAHSLLAKGLNSRSRFSGQFLAVPLFQEDSRELVDVGLSDFILPYSLGSPGISPLDPLRS